MTGVPLQRLEKDEAQRLLELEKELHKKVISQDDAIKAIAKSIRRARAGLKDPKRPMGSFIFLGPTGVGKTLLAKALAEFMFGDEEALVHLDMSEYMEKHNVSRLVGAPPGYVGYEEGGQLTERIRRRPYSVVLLDEVEKAHLDVLNLFYQVFDKGILSDGEGKEIDFSNTVIFLTSNLASDVISEMTSGGVRADPDTLLAAVRPILSNHFKPALLARMTVIPYVTLAQDALAGIVRLKLDKIVRRLAHNNKLPMTYSDAVVTTIAARCTEVETGARNIDFILRKNVMPLMSQEILSRMGSGEQPASIALEIDEAGEFQVRFPAQVSA
jgi:type VI secretion system protein VasG